MFITFNRVLLISLIFMCFKCISAWSWNPLCLITECCNKDYILDDIYKMRNIIRSKVYGQHLVNTAIDAIESHLLFKSSKPLTLSFHGWPGSGKNYVSSFIAESLYKNGLKSKFVHNFIGRVHFPMEKHADTYRDNLYVWLKGNLTSCPKQLFIFDEVDKMPSTVLNAIKPMIDYRSVVDGVDYTNAIFIFLSNTGAALINEHYQEMWSKGKQREEMKLSDFESLISKGAFNEEGGFHHSDTIKSNLIDHYIPFLPMQENHIEECIKDEFSQRGVREPKKQHIQEVLEFIEWGGPGNTKLFSKTGCKRIGPKVAILVGKHYQRRTELYIIMTQKASGELELIEMQEDQALQLKFKSTSITEFCKFVPESKYPELKKAACRIISILGTTYVCESFYSTLKFVKSKHRSVLINQHLKELEALSPIIHQISKNYQDK